MPPCGRKHKCLHKSFKCILFTVFSFPFLKTTYLLPCFIPALTNLAAAPVVQSPVEGLEARLATLREGIVDVPTTEGAVERAQVSDEAFQQNLWNTDPTN